MKIVVATIPGNFFEAAEYLNEHDLGQYLKQFTHVGNYTQAVLIVPAKIATKLHKDRIV